MINSNGWLTFDPFYRNVKMIFLQILYIYSMNYRMHHICRYCCPALVLCQALYLLLQCNYNVDEALRRHQLQVIPPTGDSSRHFVFIMLLPHKVKTLSIAACLSVHVSVCPVPASNS